MNTRSLRHSALLLALLAPSSALAQTKTWTVAADFNQGTLSGVEPPGATPNQLVLGGTPVSKTTLVWATNYLYGYVVRIDSTTGKQTGRFDSSLQFINGQATGAPPPNEYCNFSSTGNCPGRVTVDTNGDVWIINRAFGKQGSLSKFSGSIDRCIDRNGNGIIDTSFDKNGDGVISVVAGDGEYFGQNDECILTTIPIGAVNQWPRGVAVDKRGKIWASTHNDGKLYRINPNEPLTIEATITVGGQPYSLATGGDYVFVSSSSGNGTRRVHIDTLAVQNLNCPGTYGVVGEPSGNVAWLGGYFSGNGVYRADFTSNTCTFINVSGQNTAITLDLAGNVWSAGYNNNVLHKISPAGVLLGTYPAGGTSPHGLSVDFQGNLWTILHGPTPSVSKINVNSGAIQGTYGITGPGVPDADPYLYSDFTGTQVNRQAPYVKVGSWSAIHDSTTNDTPWAKLVWNSEASGAVPAETSLKVLVRAANSQAALAVAPFIEATNGAALSGIKGRLVEIQANFSGPGFVTPVLSDVTLEGPCGAVGSEACCTTSADCADSDLCTTDTCPTPGGACVHAAIPQCCHTGSDCNDGNPCTTDSCPSDGALCLFDPAPGCCFTNADCADSDPCSQDICSGPGGTCSHPVINGCCNDNADCAKNNTTCSSSTCSGPGGTCQTTLTPNCCTKNADCVDGNPCTTDACDTATGVCQNNTIAGCCSSDGECNDGIACTTDKCSGPGGVCVATQTPGCCNSDADCDDGNPCTTETCSGPGGICQPQQVPGCCATNADCADGNPCTTDTCPTPGGACENTPTLNCCLKAADCDDGDLCTKDTCAFAGSTCAHSPISACCKVDGDCNANETCQDNVCTPIPTAGSGGSAGAGGDAGQGGAGQGGAGEGGVAGAGGAGEGGAAGEGGSSTGGLGGTDAAGQGGAGQAGTGGAGQAGTSPAKAGAGQAGTSAPTPSPNTAAAADLEGGCGCRVPAPSRSPQAPLSLALATLALLVVRRRR